MDCAIDLSNDVEEMVDIISKTMPIARKQHKCGECHEIIEIGDQYEHVKCTFLGKLTVYKTCSVCREIRDEFFDCWRYEMIWEDLEESECELQMDDLMNFSPSAQQKLIEKLL